jgi:Chalcone isomerase-like
MEPCASAPAANGTDLMNRSMSIRILATLALLFSCAVTFARDVAGVTLPDSITLAAGRPPLVLNGAGVRSKFFIKVYVGALYLPESTTNPWAVLRHTGPVAVHMYFVHSEVTKEKLVNAWNEGFAANLDPAEHAKLKERIERFNGLFRTVRQGDVVRLDYVPGTGTAVSINGDKRGVIEGEDFMHAWLRIWLGDHPADDDLKRAMLGAT